MGDQQMLDGFKLDSKSEVKKRRGRPSKDKSDNPDKIKKRKYTKKVKEEVTEPKKRGRKPKVKDETVEVKVLKKRGRKPKVKDETVEVKVLKKRGRKPKVKNVEPVIKRKYTKKVKNEVTEIKVLKKRGRKPKTLEISQIVAVADKVVDMPVKIHKKRGRPAKVKDESEVKVLKKRGRPPKTSDPTCVTNEDKAMRRLIKKESETRDLFGPLKLKKVEENQEETDKRIREFICKEVRQMYGWLACHRLICGIGRECEERLPNCNLLMDNVDRYIANFGYEEIGDASRIIRKKKKE